MLLRADFEDTLIVLKCVGGFEIFAMTWSKVTVVNALGRGSRGRGLKDNFVCVFSFKYGRLVIQFRPAVYALCKADTEIHWPLGRKVNDMTHPQFHSE